MSALLTPRRRVRRARDARRDRGPQESLFAAAPAPVVPAAEPQPAPTAAEPRPSPTAGERRQGPTLDDLVVGAWEGLLAGSHAECLVCGTVLTPRHSAGAGVVGGRCGGCGSTLG